MKKPITLPARPQTKVHRGVDRIEPETGAEMGGIGAEAVIGVGAEHDQALDEQDEGEAHHPHHERHAGDLDRFLDRVLVVLVDLRIRTEGRPPGAWSPSSASWLRAAGLL